MSTGKTTKPVEPSRTFKASAYLRDETDIAAYLESVLEDGDMRAVPVALRTVAEAMGGMTALAARTGLSRETLYRTLSEKGNPRLDSLTAILTAFGLRLAVAPANLNHGTGTRAAAAAERSPRAAASCTRRQGPGVR